MRIGDRLRRLRQQRNLSQGDVETRTGILRCYVSRVENGQTSPTVETLEKLARALEVPLYRLFYDGDGHAELPKAKRPEPAAELLWGHSGCDARLLADLRGHLSQTSERDRWLLLLVARKMARANYQKGAAHLSVKQTIGEGANEERGTNIYHQSPDS